MHITMGGGLFASLGVDKPYPGELSLEDGKGKATGTLIGEISREPGQLTFASDTPGVKLELILTPRSGALTPRYFAHGLAVSVVRNSKGVLSVSSVP
jgi:hypothetical protein